ncbi:MAG: pilus assembly protein [Pseudomonadota bacterium]
MINALTTFVRDETGAVTVEFVVLAAAVVGLGLSYAATVRDGIQNTTTEVAQRNCGTVIETTFTRVDTSQFEHCR